MIVFTRLSLKYLISHFNKISQVMEVVFCPHKARDVVGKGTIALIFPTNRTLQTQFSIFKFREKFDTLDI